MKRSKKIDLVRMRKAAPKASKSIPLVAAAAALSSCGGGNNANDYTEWDRLAELKDCYSRNMTDLRGCERRYYEQLREIYGDSPRGSNNNWAANAAAGYIAAEVIDEIGDVAEAAIKNKKNKSQYNNYSQPQTYSSTQQKNKADAKPQPKKTISSGGFGSTSSTKSNWSGSSSKSSWGG